MNKKPNALELLGLSALVIGLSFGVYSFVAFTASKIAVWYLLEHEVNYRFWLGVVIGSTLAPLLFAYVLHLIV